MPAATLDAPDVAVARGFMAVVPLRDGGTIRIRAIQPDDKPRLIAHFAHLSPESVYHRFFTMKKSLTPQDLRNYTELDFVDAVGLVATAGDGAEERIVGVGRFFVIPDRPGAPRRAEVAFAVEDAQQGRGIATQLLAQLVPWARRSGVVSLEGDVLDDNIHMLHVFSRMGFVVEGRCCGVAHMTFRVPQPGAGETW
jgi:GNAT superfamily N-acetyltransferase